MASNVHIMSYLELAHINSDIEEFMISAGREVPQFCVLLN
jgi:hypothetical protein